jgi:hypothetical protein
MSFPIDEHVALLCWIDHEIVVVQAIRATHTGDDGVSGFQINNRPELPLVYYFDRHEGLAWSRDLSADAELHAAYALVRSSLTEADLPVGPIGREGPRASSVWLP